MILQWGVVMDAALAPGTGVVFVRFWGERHSCAAEGPAGKSVDPYPVDSSNPVALKLEKDGRVRGNSGAHPPASLGQGNAPGEEEAVVASEGFVDGNLQVEESAVIELERLAAVVQGTHAQALAGMADL